MNWHRFGNAFVARRHDTTFVISFYQNRWCAHYRRDTWSNARQIDGESRFSTPAEARSATDTFAEKLEVPQ